MKYMINVLFFVSSCLIITNAQILYQCNFDNDTIITSCLKPEQLAGVLISEQLGSAGIQPPISPLSDVTSSLKPTSNGQSCNLPYKLDSFTWDMYFCNDGYCQTSTDSTSKCSSGQFGYFNFQAPRKVSFTLNTASGGADGTDEQCLIYYYYLSKVTGTEQSIIIRKQEVGDSSETIDSVTSSPHNGWIKRQVSFHTSKGGYKIYFDFERISGPNGVTTIIGIDEISVLQGDCPTELVTGSTSEISVGTTITEWDMTTSNTTETISTVQTTDTIVTESSSSMESITTTTTATTTTTTATSTTTATTTSATTATTTITSTTTTTTTSTTTTITSISTSTISTTTTALTTTSATTTTTSASTTTSTATTTTTSTTTVITTTTTATTTTTTASTTISTSTITSPTTTVITTTATTTSTSVQTTTSTTSTSSAHMITTTTMLTTTATVFTNQPSPTTMITNSTSNVTQSTTIDSLENTTKKDPSKRTLIIALATGVPAALIIVVIIGVWIKRSAVGGLLSGISHPFTDITDQNEMTTFKLNDLQDDHAF
ncbi:unnamed protein product [Adineta steineri]|uniref:MAM domain-containing protein n=1 Tax=Adineta steineri TaxID=433720 RepID=A0A819I352_9BILA|nr:unnamed protein product [Adineta steineri]CAF3910303.1 unnamed protein product [Adineta steineri]